MKITSTYNYSARAILDYFSHSNIVIGIGYTEVNGLISPIGNTDTELPNLVGYLTPTKINILYENPLGLELIQGVRYSKIDSVNYNTNYLTSYKSNILLISTVLQHADILTVDSTSTYLDLIGVYSEVTEITGSETLKTTRIGGHLDFIVKTKKIKVVDGSQTGINVIINF